MMANEGVSEQYKGKRIKLKLFSDNSSENITPAESMLNINMQKWLEDNPQVRIVDTKMETRIAVKDRGVHFLISILVHYEEASMKSL